MNDVKYDSDIIQKEGKIYLKLFADKMRDLASEIIGEIEVKTLPHIETDAWTNYREYLRSELEHEYKYSKFKEPWAANFRKAVFVENREEMAQLISKDILDRIKHLEDCRQEYECFRYTPLGDTYQCLKKQNEALEEKLRVAVEFVNEADCWCDYEGDNTEITLCKRCKFLAKLKGGE